MLNSEMLGWLGLPSVYLLCLASGVVVERRLPVNNLLQRILVVFTLGAAQLVLAVQGLSLGKHLSGAALIWGNLVLSALVAGAARFWPPAAEHEPWAKLWAESWTELRAQPREPVSLVFLAVAAGALLFQIGLGAAVIPISDIYHFEMPLYWRQNHSIAPFPIDDPRIVTVAFVGEALALPGYLYTNSGVMFVLLTLMAGALCLGVIFALAHRLGCGAAASACAAAIALGFSQFTEFFLSVRAGTYLAALWSGAGLLLLLDARPRGSLSKPGLTLAGYSLFTFVMACGAKNSITLLAPAYLVCAVLCFRSLFCRWQVLLAWTLSGGIALLCSGVPWNNLQNFRWFGNLKGPQLIQETVSSDFGPRAVWTRIARGTVLLAMDTIFVPKSLRPAYGKVGRTAVRCLGGQDTLREDGGFYGFGETAVAPQGGLGLLGILFFLPAAALALVRSVGFWRSGPGLPDAHRFNTALLLFMVVASFVVCHAVFRWESIGLLRLMPAFSILAAPLCALLLVKRWPKLVALVLLLVSTLMFLTSDLAMVGRRLEKASGMRLLQWVNRLAKEHSYRVECQSFGAPPVPLLVREDYSSRELLQAFLRTVPQPATIGFIGHDNFESYYLFGHHFGNRLVSLTDCRTPGQILDPAEKPRFLVISACDAQKRAWASRHDYRSIFEATTNQTCLLAGFERRASPKTP